MALELMQLRSFVARSLAKEVGIQWSDAAIYNPEVNISLGLYYLTKLLSRSKNVHVADIKVKVVPR